MKQGAFCVCITQINTTYSMKKIFTLVAALAAGASTMHAISTDNLPTGYYTMASCATGDVHKRIYAFNDAASTITSGSYKASERTLLSETLGTTNNYYWRIVNTGGTTIQIVNGQGTAVMYEDGNHGATGVYKKTTLTPVDASSTYPTAVYFSDGLCKPQDTDGNHTYGDSYSAMNVYSGYVGDITKWNFTKSEEGKTFYTVSITGSNTSEYITRTSTSERAYNSGFFVVDNGTTFAESDFTASTNEHYTSAISIDNTAHTITVSYTINAAGVNVAIATAKEAIAKVGVGYPTATSSVRTALQSAITAAETAVSNNSELQTAHNALLTATTNFKSATTDIQFPEDGHTYVFTNVHPSYGKHYINYVSSGCTLADRGTGDAESLPQSAKFTCRVQNGKYVFVNNEGKYLCMKYSNASTSTSGYKDTYDATFCPMTFMKMAMTTNQTTSASSIEDLFGFVCFGATRTDKTSISDGNSTFFIIKNDGNFDRANLTTFYYNTNYSSAFQVEEVSYPNKVTFNATTGVDNIEKIATFSAPFATVVPTGVTAWYGETVGDDYVSLEQIESGKAIPANQGVLLTATSDVTNLYLTPATTETTATIDNNALGNTAGAAKELTEEMHAYILTKDPNTQQTAFCKGKIGTTLKMNKSYLADTGSNGGSALKMLFGGKPSTSIANVLAPNMSNAPIYDLTGRRVNKTTKGHLYIKNGRKFIAQ